MFLSQLKAGGIICRQGEAARLVPGFNSTYELAKAAIAAGTSVAALIEKQGQGDTVDLVALAAEGKLDCPVRHPDPAHMYLTGTGLTHTGSASARDNMHADTAGMSDSMKMFRMGLEGGKPKPGETGVQPEWFYKGNGFNAVAPGDDLVSPSFALDGGEEPEMAGYYIIGDDGTAHRLGFSVANEFSDHVTEKINYLFLAHSKLRPASFGPELRVGALPDHVEGTSRIVRGGQTVWEKPFLSGEANMSHTIANLEYHHFKYALFCQPGDLHIHMYGTATLSVADGFVTQEGDVFEIESPQFGLPLRNRLAKAAVETVKVKML
ncbi:MULTISPECIES: AraD1 family protein [unclassified Agrobacterium]|uniref:AraD1 family protein n=1 Tax=unclassified Agrobacterium TaxID=2632611 RepID=UPI00083D9520|nr:MULTISPECIES: AraD1 family protein [unclassified Agrobacterium]AOG08446.1 fumarylacetoacetate (FAA) hydrolase family protein [Agrobacterium sp. RAC06]QGG92548.1 GguC protein [Agrobacterium sp. MA01]